MKCSLRNLSCQNQYAAQNIQSVFRGFICRKALWGWNGELTQWTATKIQRSWRGYIGRQIAAARYLQYLSRKADIIQGVFRCWRARRILRIKKAESLIRKVVLLQTCFRGRAGRKAFRELREKYRAEKATKIEKCARGMISRTHSNGLWILVTAARSSIEQIYVNDIKISNTLKRPVTLGDMCVDRHQGGPAMLRQLMGYAVGTKRWSTALNLAYQICEDYPDFMPAYFALHFLLLHCWSAAGPERSVREDYLEEAVGIAKRLQRMEQHAKTSPQFSSACSLLHDDTSSVFETTIDLPLLEGLEKAYLWNTFRLRKINSVNLSMMCSYQLARSFSAFGSGVFVNKHGSSTIDRAHRLQARSRQKASFRDTEAVELRGQVLENLYIARHDSLFKQRCQMRDLLDDDYVAGSGNRKICVDLEMFRCGDMLVVTGEIPALKTDSTSNINSNDGLSGVQSKWATGASIRPLVLTVSEVSAVYDLAVAFFVRTLSKTDVEVMRMPRGKILSDYILQGIRVVSTGRLVAGVGAGAGLQRDSHTKSNSNQYRYVSVARLALPFVEYRRRERNELRLEDHSTKIIQRAYRGFQGRALWRRLHLHIVEEHRQHENKSKMEHTFLLIRMERFRCLQSIQRIVRGYFWRKRLKKMTEASVVIQCCARSRIARRRVDEERLRAKGGPRVTEMIRRPQVVSGRTMTLVVYRCGVSFKLVGFDLINGLKYEGFVYQPEVMDLLKEHNANIEGDTRAAQQLRVMPWQHARVVEVLVKSLSLTSAIALGPSDLRKDMKAFKSGLVFVAKPKQSAGGIDRSKRSSPLEDQMAAVKRFEEIVANRKREATLRKRKGAKKIVDAEN